MSDASDDRMLAHDMIEVHGDAAVTVARSNARRAALAGQVVHAKSWIRVLAIIPATAGKQALRTVNSADHEIFDP